MSSVFPPNRKLVKFVIATADKLRIAANAAILIVNPAIKAERIATSPVIEPSVKPATISNIGSFFRRRLLHSLPICKPFSVG